MMLETVADNEIIHFQQEIVGRYLVESLLLNLYGGALYSIIILGWVSAVYNKVSQRRRFSPAFSSTSLANSPFG